MLREQACPAVLTCPPLVCRTRELRDLLPAGGRGRLYLQRRLHHQEVGCADRAVSAGVPGTHVHREQVSGARGVRTGDRDVGCGPPALEELSFGGEAARSTGQWKPQDRGVPGRDKCQLPRAAGVCVLGVGGRGCRLGGGGAGREASPTLRLVPGHPRGPYSTTAPSWVQGKGLGGYSAYRWEQIPEETA